MAIDKTPATELELTVSDLSTNCVNNSEEMCCCLSYPNCGENYWCNQIGLRGFEVDRKFERVMKCNFGRRDALIDNEGSGDKDPSTPPAPADALPRLPLFRHQGGIPAEIIEWRGWVDPWQPGRERRLTTILARMLPPSHGHASQGLQNFGSYPNRHSFVCDLSSKEHFLFINRLIN